MRKIFFTYYTGFCGSDGHEVTEFDDNVTDKELDDYAWQGALANAETYGIYPEEDKPEDYDDENDIWVGDRYSFDIEGCWVDYDEEKHGAYV